MTKNNMPIWRQELKLAREKEGDSPLNRWIQLATVNKNNEPRLRTIVFRGWHKENSIIIFTDKRSEKIEHLKFNNNAEISWLFLRSKSQFRLKGKMKEITENTNYWNTLTQKSKLTWLGQNPGRKVNKQLKSPKEISGKICKPENFIVLGIEVYSVDLLKLIDPLNKRYIWNKRDNWKTKEINP